MPMDCPLCLAAMPDDDLFCEDCGASLCAEPAEPPACLCGAPEAEIGEDGYCSRCGRLVNHPPEDHIEIELSPDCAAVCDRGLRHSRNEDRAAIREFDGACILVVCDGVSSSRDSELASSTVAASIAESLPQMPMLEAIANANAMLAAYRSHDDEDNPPSTTVVAALIADGYATVGWVGDSRAYWIGSDGARQLTVDHSWGGEQSHAITRWLGADAGENAAPEMVRLAISEPGILLLCTDGLWNYAPTEADIERLIHAAEGMDALETGRSLVAFANAEGGHDNITAAILHCSPAALNHPDHAE